MMATITRERFRQISDRYDRLQIVVVGDFCLDRYLEIDPSRQETSIETGRTVHNVVRVRALPGGAGTIVNNLAALGVGRITPVGFCGDDGEGYELRRALAALPGVDLGSFLSAPDRRTFTYCKPLVIDPGGGPPVELERLDSKNWDSTPGDLSGRLADRVLPLGRRADAVIVLEQVDQPGTGAVTHEVRQALERLAQDRPELPILADSRQGLRDWPPLSLKMNAAELGRLAGCERIVSREAAAERARPLAASNGRPVFVTLSEQGILAIEPTGSTHHAPSLPTRGPIDIVGAGDAVTANLAASLAGGASLAESVVIAMAGASVVVHKLGCTGTASPSEIEARLRS